MPSDLRRDYMRQFKEEHRVETRVYDKQYYWEHREEAIARGKRGRAKVRLEILTHYGNGQVACVRCGFNDARALSIDHIKGGGNQHRNSVQRHGTAFYNWLRKLGFPEGYQTLCMNCQWIKRREEGEDLAVHNAGATRRAR